MTIPRLPPRPELDWKPDGTPVARGHDDVYFSAHDGLEETRATFLKACGLPERWAGREDFTVAELGFGTGLNFLALWQLWQVHRPGPSARLHFVSFEGALMTAEEAARALARWPDLAGLAEMLAENWPERARGIQRTGFPDGVSLTLHLDDINTALPRSDVLADAWFLDGFAPAKNAGMWAETLWPLIAARSNEGAKVGTYTVAGTVRRGLSAAGFHVVKAPGHGRKRERLEAYLKAPPARVPDPFAMNARVSAGPPRRIAILGGGIAGACLAAAARMRDAQVSLFDPAPAFASGASGNRLALVMPRLDAGDSSQARALVDAYLAACRFYHGRAGVGEVTVEQRARDEAESFRFAKLLADPPLGSDRLGGTAKALIHERALVLSPAELIADLVAGAALRLGQPVAFDPAARTVNGEAFDAVFVASGMALASLAPPAFLPLEARLGQVEWADAPDDIPRAIARGHYAISDGRTRLWGASFEAARDGEPRVSETARAANAEAVRALMGEGWADLSAAQSRAGLRATMPDRMPVLGPLPDFAAATEQFAAVRNGAAPAGTAPVREGVYLVGGLGSRGFTFAPWAAGAVMAMAFGEPSVLAADVARTVSPMRFLFRALKRGEA